DVCKACGAQLVRHRRIKSDSILSSLINEVKIGKRSLKVWSVCIISLAVVLIAAASVYAIPAVRDYVVGVGEKEDIPEVVPQAPTATDSVSGTIMVITKSMFEVSNTDVVVPSPSDAAAVSGADAVVSDADDVNSDCKLLANVAYDDGSWLREYLVYGEIKVKLLRKAASEDYLLSQVQEYYPNVANVEAFSESPTVSGYESTRLQFPYYQDDTASVVDVVCVSVDDIAFTVIVDTPETTHSEHELDIDEWLRHLMLIDAVTGEEYIKTVPSDSDIPSGSDADVSHSDAAVVADGYYGDQMSDDVDI
ncbi:MAG: hypothetical protein IJP17_04020, partial [Clostridia bacterium]|nr:hypothetical protein [Clostridia bacterium]